MTYRQVVATNYGSRALPISVLYVTTLRARPVLCGFENNPAAPVFEPVTSVTCRLTKYSVSGFGVKMCFGYRLQSVLLLATLTRTNLGGKGTLLDYHLRLWVDPILAFALIRGCVNCNSTMQVGIWTSGGAH